MNNERPAKDQENEVVLDKIKYLPKSASHTCCWGCLFWQVQLSTNETQTVRNIQTNKVTELPRVSIACSDSSKPQPSDRNTSTDFKFGVLVWCLFFLTGMSTTHLIWNLCHKLKVSSSFYLYWMDVTLLKLTPCLKKKDAHSIKSVTQVCCPKGCDAESRTAISYVLWT